MSRVPVPCFTAVCDGMPSFRRCGAAVTDDTDWAGWDEDGLDMQLDESDWITSDDGTMHLCDYCHYRLVNACEFLTGIEL